LRQTFGQGGGCRVAEIWEEKKVKSERGNGFLSKTHSKTDKVLGGGKTTKIVGKGLGTCFRALPATIRLEKLESKEKKTEKNWGKSEKQRKKNGERAVT